MSVTQRGDTRIPGPKTGNTQRGVTHRRRNTKIPVAQRGDTQIPDPSKRRYTDTCHTKRRYAETRSTKRRYTDTVSGIPITPSGETQKLDLA